MYEPLLDESRGQPIKVCQVEGNLTFIILSLAIVGPIIKSSVCGKYHDFLQWLENHANKFKLDGETKVTK